MPTWYEPKRLANIAKHGIDFIELSSIFHFPLLTQTDKRYAYDNQRFQSLAWFRGKVVYVVWREEDEDIHFISCRYATRFESRQYLNTYPVV